MARDEDKVRRERATAVALFRYSLIRPAADPSLSSKQRGVLVRELAGRVHPGPDGHGVRVSRETIDRWIKAWRAGGFDALIPAPRNVAPRTPQAVLDVAFALKKERPERTAAQVAAILREHFGDGPAERTLQTHFARAGLNRPLTPEQVFGRFEAAAANDRWTGDALHGPLVGGGKALLFAWLDDHCRLLTGYRWVRREDTVRAESVLRPAIGARGVPAQCYLDNGAPFVDAQLKQTLARLGVALTHSAPGRPQGRGKIERFFRTVRDQFLVEVDDDRYTSMDEFNRAFTAWVETVYHRRVHTETGQTPLERWEASWRTRADAGLPGPRYLTPDQITEAFRWSEHRTVTRTATIQLLGNTYQVDAVLAGRRVEVRFDPFDMDQLDVYLAGTHQGAAVPHVIRTHTHPKARADETTPAAPATGISYLDQITARHERHLAAKITFAAPAPPAPASTDTTTAVPQPTAGHHTRYGQDEPFTFEEVA
jgi:putative transposase